MMQFGHPISYSEFPHNYSLGLVCQPIANHEVQHVYLYHSPATEPSTSTSATTTATIPDNPTHQVMPVTSLPSGTSPTPCSCEEAQCEEVCPSSSSSLAAILGSSIPLTILAIMVSLTVSVVAVCKYQSKLRIRYD